MCIRMSEQLHISIHLMLLFISLHLFFLHLTYRISIHLMLLFIGFCVFCIIPIILISIHLMLLFIFVDARDLQKKTEFQYISCYCLSLVILTIAQNNSNFNTSHVTVYLLPLHNPPVISIFQYISCYCLSGWEDARGCVIEQFQYISCYCLSC